MLLSIQDFSFILAFFQFGAGIWGGCLAMATGIAGVFASAKTLCPLKSTAQTVARTVYLALSLISLAISQLVVVIAATGVARDINFTESDDKVLFYPILRAQLWEKA